MAEDSISVGDVNPTLIQGYVVNARDTVPVYGAHIVNRNRNSIVNSSNTGSFAIQAIPGDSIFITAVGFELERFAFNGENDLLLIFLSPKRYSVGEVKVYPFPSPQHLKAAMLNLDLPNEYVEVEPPPRVKRTEVLSAPEGGFGFGISGPITALYNWLSKEGKNRRELKRVMDLEEYREALAQQYSDELVLSVTGLPEELIPEFLDFCEESDDFKQSVVDQEIVSGLTDCYFEFIKQK